LTVKNGHNINLWW